MVKKDRKGRSIAEKGLGPIVCRPYRPDFRGCRIPRPDDLGYYVTALQALLGRS